MRVEADADAVAAIATALAAAPLVAFDLEFLAQDRLVPTLCLVQVAWLEHVRLDAPAAAIVAWSAQQAGALPGRRPWFYVAFGDRLTYYHATAWLAILLISIILRTGGWSLFFRKEQERLDLGEG